MVTHIRSNIDQKALLLTISLLLREHVLPVRFWSPLLFAVSIVNKELDCCEIL